MNSNANINVHLIKYKFTNLSQERKLLVTIGQVFIGPISAISRRHGGKNAYTKTLPPAPDPPAHQKYLPVVMCTHTY